MRFVHRKMPSLTGDIFHGPSEIDGVEPERRERIRRIFHFRVRLLKGAQKKSPRRLSPTGTGRREVDGRQGGTWWSIKGLRFLQSQDREEAKLRSTQRDVLRLVPTLCVSVSRRQIGSAARSDHARTVAVTSPQFLAS